MFLYISVLNPVKSVSVGVAGVCDSPFVGETALSFKKERPSSWQMLMQSV